MKEKSSFGLYVIEWTRLVSNIYTIFFQVILMHSFIQGGEEANSKNFHI